MCTCVCGGQRSVSNVFLNHFICLWKIKKDLTEPETRLFGWPRNPCSLSACHSSLGYRWLLPVCLWMLWIQTWGLMWLQQFFLSTESSPKTHLNLRFILCLRIMAIVGLPSYRHSLCIALNLLLLFFHFFLFIPWFLLGVLNNSISLLLVYHIYFSFLFLFLVVSLEFGIYA